MEEDIKILKELKEVQEKCIEHTQDSPFTDLWKMQNKAIENILNRLEQLEKENEELKESHDYIYEAYQDAGKKMFDYQEQLENSIPKSVIRENIEELEGNREKIEDKYYFDYQNNIYDFIAGMKKGLKELLGEE